MDDSPYDRVRNTPVENKESSLKRFYRNNKETILITAVVILGVKNAALRSENRRLTRNMREAKQFMDEAKVQLEALALFDQAFGPRRIHSKHT